MKRSRVNRSSSSFGNIRVLNPPPPAAASAPHSPSLISPYAPPPKVWEMARVGILTLSLPTPVVAVENGQWLWQGHEQVGYQDHFLDRCFFCKKVLTEKDTRFMYGDFRAFCTPECRTKQIADDDEKVKVSKQSTGTKMEGSRKNGFKYLSGAQIEKHAF